jgi:sarcosine oxidase gamma subunit
MKSRRTAHRVLAGFLAAAGLGAAAPAVAPQLLALAKVEGGEWQLKAAGSQTTRSLCVSDPGVLLQLGHAGAQCSRFVIADAPDAATVHYTCPGSGHGRTTIAIETPRLFRLQTQGIADGAPFDLDYEGRRVGACAGKSLAPR